MYIRFFLLALIAAQIALLIVFFPRISAYFSDDASTPSTPPVAIPESPQEESIRIRAVDGKEVTPSIAVITNKINSLSCKEIGDFASKAGATAITNWLKIRGAEGRINTKVTVNDQRFRVYVGEFAEEEEAQFAQQIVQKRHADFKDVLIYQSNENWRVSFGEFDNKTEAESFKTKLETMVEGLRISIDSLQQTSTKVSLRFVDEDAQRVHELALEPALATQLDAYLVAISDCQ